MIVHLPESFTLSEEEWARTPRMIKKVLKDIYDINTVVNVYAGRDFVEIEFRIKEND